MESVTLKNGTEEVRSLVAAILLSLQSLIETYPIAFYDLVQLCRDPEYKTFNIEILKSWTMIQEDGSIHTSIRNVVLNAVTGEGINLKLESPVA